MGLRLCCGQVSDALQLFISPRPRPSSASPSSIASFSRLIIIRLCSLHASTCPRAPAHPRRWPRRCPPEPGSNPNRRPPGREVDSQPRQPARRPQGTGTWTRASAPADDTTFPARLHCLQDPPPPRPGPHLMLRLPRGTLRNGWRRLGPDGGAIKPPLGLPVLASRNRAAHQGTFPELPPSFSARPSPVVGSPPSRTCGRGLTFEVWRTDVRLAVMLLHP
jgi:hypothetical protein